jgi:hypothetical protein
MNTGAQADVDSAKTATAQSTGESGVAAPLPSDTKSNDDPDGSMQFNSSLQGDSSGTVSKDVRRQVAEMFHDRITNMTTDMITAEMEIFGDPYFLPQETGNYVAKQGDKPSTTEDGTMTYQQTQVFCVINFKTPFDYQIKGATMEMPQIVPGFSGLFTIWAVKNIFSKGQFKQTLKLIRRRGQADPATTGNTGFIQSNNEVAIAKETAQSDGTVGQSALAPAQEANAEPSNAEKLGSLFGAPTAQFGEIPNQGDDIKNFLPDPGPGFINTVAEIAISATSDASKAKIKGLLTGE